MAKRYLGDDGWLLTLKENNQTLLHLLGISGATSLDEAVFSLEKITTDRRYSGYALTLCRATDGGVVSSALAAGGVFAELEGRSVPSATSCQAFFPSDKPVRLQPGSRGNHRLFAPVATRMGLVAFGVHARVGSGVGNFGLIVCSSVESARSDVRTTGDTDVLQLALLAVVQNHLDATSADQSAKLPRGEAEVLAAYANGRTPKEIAEERQTSVRTVRNQLDSVRQRLSARTNAHAVALATACNAIPISVDSIVDFG